ncbi:MAG: hypothetical protein C0405_14205, partial [Desulfovibrio sp.]|nr:hypothetical protein [Desulfovibrio sp.]
GDPKSQYNLGHLLLSGQELTRNAEQAYYWLTLAERHGQAEARAQREKAAKELSGSQITTQDSRVAAFKPKTPGK